jgi:peptide-methionine (S)-S-oxide reductase
MLSRIAPVPLFRKLAIVGLAAVILGLGIARFSLPISLPKSISAAAFPEPIAAAEPNGAQTVVFAGGCFWGMEAMFEHLKGVSSAVPGFSGGSAETAHYKTVSAGGTGHAESVKITYDPSQISYAQLLKVFFTVAHDPTQLNQQGFDIGTQYRSAVFFTTDEQKQTTESYINQLNQAHLFYQPIVTQVVPLNRFYPAEDYHQHFVEKHPHNFYVMMNEMPKLAHLQKEFPDLYSNPN